ncbi:nucleoporin complex subunit 54-domain-containing protein [Blastocladiella britannica]|nr:nucleoporin complex subunit 54-domain-containing protein [Blastocladiella britannica]
MAMNFNFGTPTPAGGAAALGVPASFGAPANSGPASAPATGAPGFNFGANAGAPASRPATPALTGFGVTPAVTSAGAVPGGFGGFGAAAAKPPTITTGFGGAGFGAAAGTPKPAGGFGLAPLGGGAAAGAAPAASRFGFGGVAGGSLTLGAGAGASGFQRQQQQQQQQQQQMIMVPANYPQVAPSTPESKLAAIKAAWDAESPSCQFKHYFYMTVHPDEVKFYGPGPRDVPAEYENAQKKSPDPTCTVPALAVGFGDLQARSAAQQQHLTTLVTRTKEIAITVADARSLHAAHNGPRIAEARRKLQATTARALRVMLTMHRAQTAGRAVAGESEVRLREVLARVGRAVKGSSSLSSDMDITAGSGGSSFAVESMRDAATGGNGGWPSASGALPPAPGRRADLAARVGAMWSAVLVVPDRRAESASAAAANANANGTTMATAAAGALAAVLSEEATGIQHVVAALQKDAKDVETMRKALAETSTRVTSSTAGTTVGAESTSLRW